MLYKKVAIDPELFDHTFDRLRFLLMDAREGTGRFYAAFPKKWISKIDSLGPSGSVVQRARRREILIRARRFIVRAGTDFDGTQDWEQNAVCGVADAHFDCVVLKEGEPNPESCVVGYDWMDHPKSPWRIRESKLAEPTSENLMRAVRRLVDESSLIKLVDRYLDPQSPTYARSLNFLMKNCGPHIEQIQLHIPYIEPTGGRRQMESLPPERFREIALEMLEIPAGIDVVVLHWRDDETGPDMHDRYLLTYLGGIHTGRGFPDQPEKETTTSRLSRDDRLKLWDRYDDHKPMPESLVDRIELT
jgi:hypothetical protein